MAETNASTGSTMEQQKVKEITDKLEQGLQELFESEKYRTYLSVMSKFHNYSFNNTLLIALQKPDATLVAGFKAWQKNFERHVNRGEKAIRILAPAPYKIKEERNKLDPVTGEMMLDENGVPQTEQVEITIPAFKAVSVFDVSQTDGKPIPELGAVELNASVEAYEDFWQALNRVAPVPIGFEDIPGDSKGYFNTVEKRIAIQEGMSESQTIKTGIHEVAHSMLHNREVERAADPDAPAKDRNTKEVEAESVAFTVCQHFGIDTSDYSFGYIAGWSSGKDMKELKSSLDTIRKTASELIAGIERELQEIQKNREAEQEQAPEKETLLLIQNNDLTEYSLLSVGGMDTQEVLAALADMGQDDKLNIPAFLESRGAWVVEAANQDTRESREYHLDVRYNVDTDVIIDIKAEMEAERRAKEPIADTDVILKIAFPGGEDFEVERITNRTPDEAWDLMEGITKLEDKSAKGVREYLKNEGVDFVPIIVSGGRNSMMPQFNDFEVDLQKEEITTMHSLSPAKQAENLINRLEFTQTAFSADERDLIVDYAYKLGDMDKTRELAKHIFSEEVHGNRDAALAAMTDAQAEVDALPDPMVSISEMHEYGYTWEKMLPLTLERALELWDQGLPVYLLHEDGSETLVEGREQAEFYEGLCGIEADVWERERDNLSEDRDIPDQGGNAVELPQGEPDKYLIYQLKDSPELRQFHFEGTESLKKMGVIKDDFDAIQPGNYNMVYEGELSDLRGETRAETLEAIYEKFNIDHPEDYRGHSLSVSDVVVLRENGETTAHFVDSFGYTELPHFAKALDGITEKGMEDEIIDLGDERESVMAEMKQQRGETELAFQIADRYISIQETDGGYDYSIIGDDYKEIDGGVYDNPDVSIREALSDIVEDLKSEPDYNRAKGGIEADSELIPIDYDGLMEKVEEAERIPAKSSVVEEFRAKTNELFHEISEMNPAEIEETVKCHVQAKLDEYGIDAEIVDAVVVGSRCRGLERDASDLDVVVELSTKEREDTLFDTFNEDGLCIGGVPVDINPIVAERTGTLETYLPQVEEYLDGVRKSREMEQQEPEKYSLFCVKVYGEERNFLNTSGLNAEELCTAFAACEKPFVDMKEYGEIIPMPDYAWMEQQEGKLAFSIDFDMDQGEICIFDGKKVDTRDMAALTEPEKPKEVEVTLIVSECSEYHDMGAFYEGIETVDEAISIMQKIDPSRMNGIPGIGINLHREGEEPYEDDAIDIVRGKTIDIAILDHIPAIKDEPKAMDVVVELIAKLPDMEIDGQLTEEQEAKMWEYRLPDLDEAGQLAAAVDRLNFSYNPEEYRDTNSSMSENVGELAELIRQGEDADIKEWLGAIIAEGADPAETERAKEILEKMTEYKPLAKVEEMEEQNYNMVDNVLNNGAGEKAQKEEAKKEHDRSAGRISLKERLAEKKALLSGQDNDREKHENSKNNRREI